MIDRTQDDLLQIKVAENERELAAVFEIRRRVFVQEQGFTLADEFDDDDAHSIHILAQFNGQSVGAARVIPDESCVKIGRVAVLPEFRNQHLGAAIMDFSENIASGKGFPQCQLHAQIQVADFYRKLGYQSQGEIFNECGWPHISMTKRLEPPASASKNQFHTTTVDQ